MRKMIIMLSCILISGCTNLNSKFDCPASPGVGCKRISDINESINDEKIDVYLKGDSVGYDYENFKKVSIKI